jgi:hypothetical protein
MAGVFGDGNNHRFRDFSETEVLTLFLRGILKNLAFQIKTLPLPLSPQLVTCKEKRFWYVDIVLECRTCVRKAGAELRLFCFFRLPVASQKGSQRFVETPCSRGDLSITREALRFALSSAMSVS